MPFRPSALVRAKKPSSKVWLARQARDPYVRLRSSPDAAVGAASYRSRSAFKLLEMDEKWQFLVHREHRDSRGEPHRDIQVVLDLGAAPGGWSQVVSQKLGWDTLKPARYTEGSEGWSAPTPSAPHNPLDISDVELLGRGQGTTIAVDLLPMIPIPGVQFIQADFLAPDTEVLIRSIIANQTATAGKADVILCDMASNSMGNVFHDIESSLAICTSVFEFSKRHLRSAESVGREMGGVLLMKHFVHPLLHMFRMQHLEAGFNDVRFIKPNSSRTESKEGYFLCRGWKG